MTPARASALMVAAIVLTACPATPVASPPASPAETAAARPSPTAAATDGATATATAAPGTPAETPTPVTDWSVLVFDRPETPATINGITLFGDTLVAVGHANYAGAVWTLAPGGEWTRQEDVPAPASETEALILTDVVAGPDGLVAVAIVGVRQSEAYASTIWTSPDGVTWTEAHRTDGVILMTLAAGDPGFVAAGTRGGFGPPRPPEISTSPDGATWTPVDTAAMGTGHVQGIAWHAGRYVAAGYTQTTDEATQAGGPTFATTWTSPDGVTWTQTFRDTRENTQFRSVAPMGDGLVAVGDRREAPSLEAWTSADATSWASVALAEQGLVRAVAGSAEGAVAVGEIQGGESLNQAAVWTSADGRSWTLVESVATELRGGLADAVMLEDRVVAGGGSAGDTEADQHPVVVTGPLP